MRSVYGLPDLSSAALALLAVLGVTTACTTSSGPAPSRIEHEPGGGFTVTQDVRVGPVVRGDFAAALRLLEEGEYDAGIERLLEVASAAPQLAAAHINLGIAYRHVERFELAEASIERALELSPRHPVAHNELGMVRRRQGRFEEARASYERALAEAADFHFARRNLGILCDLFLEDVDCALENYERYGRAFPEHAQVEIWIADLRRRADRTARNGGGGR